MSDDRQRFPAFVRVGAQICDYDTAILLGITSTNQDTHAVLNVQITPEQVEELIATLQEILPNVRRAK